MAWIATTEDKPFDSVCLATPDTHLHMSLPSTLPPAQSIGIAPLKVTAPRPVASNDEGSGYMLIFDATCSQPDFAKLFLSSGGQINTAAGSGPTDFSLTGSTSAISCELHPHETTPMALGLPTSLFSKAESGALQLDAGSKLNLGSQRVGAAINGTLVDTHSGAGAVYLGNLLRSRDTHTQVPCIYGALASHACTVGISNASIVDANGQEMDIQFTEDPSKQATLDKAEGFVEEWAQAAWKTRENVVYRPSPALTKSVAKAPVGVNDKGYELVHNVVDQEFPFGLKTLDSMLQHTIGVELAFNDDDMAQMLEATATPGMKAASWSQTVTSALSLSAAFLVAYRADGRTVMNATGSGFEAAESWLRRPMRTPCEANDCDGSGLLAISILNSARHATAEELEKYPYVRAARNAIFPYYTPAVTVVGATAAEASGGGGEHGTHIAGHALGILVPTLKLLSALDAGTASMVGGKRVSNEAPKVRDARFRAVFSEQVLAELPKEEAERLRAQPRTVLGEWPQAAQLQTWTAEGTTPASPILFDLDGARRRTAAANATRDTAAFDQFAPNVGRSLKALHAGGNGSADVHRFYAQILEISMHPDHPLYSDKTLRSMGVAASQLVLARPGAHVTEAGATPRQIATGDYVVVPLHTIDAERGAALDVAAAESKRDVLASRKGPMVLSESQSQNLRRSLAALKALDASLTMEEQQDGHTVAYTLAYSTIVNSPLAVEHFAKRLRENAIAGVVDFMYVDDLAVHSDGTQAGLFVLANVCAKV